MLCFLASQTVKRTRVWLVLLATPKSAVQEAHVLFSALSALSSNMIYASDLSALGICPKKKSEKWCASPLVYHTVPRGFQSLEENPYGVPLLAEEREALQMRV